MTFFADCWSKIEPHTLDKFRETFDVVCDYTPFVSTLSNIVGLAQKHLYLTEMKNNGTLAGNRYYTRLENKDFERYWLLFVPIFNIFAAAALSTECANNLALDKSNDWMELSVGICEDDWIELPVESYEDSEEERLGKLFAEPIDLPVDLGSIMSEKSKHIVKLNDFRNMPTETMHEIYDHFKLSSLIAFSRTCMQSWTSVNQYKNFLSSKISWLSRLQLLEFNRYAHKAYSFCLTSSLEDATLSLYLKENIPSKKVLFDHLLFLSKMKGMELNTLDREKFKQNCHIFFFEYGTDEQLFNYIENEIYQLQGVDLPNFNIKLMNAKWLERFGDSFFPLLTNERLSRFFPLLQEEEFGILPLLLNVLGRYIYAKRGNLILAINQIYPESNPIDSKLIHYQHIYICCTKGESLTSSYYFKEANKNQELNDIYCELSKLPVKKRVEICEKEIYLLRSQSDKFKEKINKLRVEMAMLFSQSKRIYECLYKENPKSTLWDVKEIKKIGDEYLETARIIHFLKSTEFIDSTDEANDLYLCELFSDFGKKSYKYLSNIEEILLEICSFSNIEELDILTEKKLNTFVRMLLARDHELIVNLFILSNKMSENINFNLLIIKATIKYSIAKKDMKILEEMFLRIGNDVGINAFIKYCLELPRDCQSVYLSALLFYSSMDIRSIKKVFVECQLNPDEYLPLSPEAYQEAFFTRKL